MLAAVIAMLMRADAAVCCDVCCLQLALRQNILQVIPAPTASLSRCALSRLCLPACRPSLRTFTSGTDSSVVFSAASQVNGSDIKNWWIYHHYVSILLTMVVIGWPDGQSASLSTSLCRPCLGLWCQPCIADWRMAGVSLAVWPSRYQPFCSALLVCL